jgi:hypothetical protein
LRRTGLLAGEGCLLVGAGGLASRISSLAVGALGAFIRPRHPLAQVRDGAILHGVLLLDVRDLRLHRGDGFVNVLLSGASHAGKSGEYSRERECCQA